MTDQCAPVNGCENSEDIDERNGNDEEKEGFTKVLGVTTTETSDFFEESTDFLDLSNVVSPLSDDSDVINSFIKNTSDDVGSCLQYFYFH